MANITIDDPRISVGLRAAVVEGCPPTEFHRVLVGLMRAGLSPGNVLVLVTDTDHGIHKHCTSTKFTNEAINLAYKRAQRPVLGRDTWVDNARKFVDTMQNLVCHHKDFYDYDGAAYRMLTPPVVASKVRVFLAQALCQEFNKEKSKIAGKDVYDEVEFNPDRNDVNEMVSALEHLTNIDVDRDVTTPCWLVEGLPGQPPARECIAMQNGILHRPTRRLLESTSNFFTVNALPFNYDPNAKCDLWLKTTTEWWPDDPDGKGAGEIALLQEMMGLLLSYDTSFQRIFAIIGDGASGKGTLAHVIFSLLGEGNYAVPTLGSLSGTFGLQNLVDKMLMCITETQIGKHDDPVKVTGLLKAISGEDPVDINRKNLTYLDAVRLFVRIVLLCNKIPQFKDDSDALARRMVVLQMRQKFTKKSGKKPDHRLRDKLAKERAGILNWALDGYDRLIEQDEFSLTEESDEAAERFLDATSQVRPFINERCIVEGMEHGRWLYAHQQAARGKVPMPFITEAALYRAYQRYCLDHGAAHESQSDFITSVCAYDHDKIRSVRPLRLDHNGEPIVSDGGAKLQEPRSLRGIRLAGGNGRGQAVATQESLPLPGKPDGTETPF